MPLTQTLKNVRWMVAGAFIFVGIIFMVANAQKNQAKQFAVKSHQLQLVNQISVSLAASAEAEKSAVMALTDADSETFASHARSAAAAAEKARLDLAKVLTPSESEAFAQFSQQFAELQRIDNEVLGLAVKNTNLKAAALTFGPATQAVKEMDAALAQSTSPAATEARVGAWRLLALLPTHIAEENDAKMDAMETEMTETDRQIRRLLDELADPAATSSYTKFSELRAQILKLSRENTNVRSFALSLTQKRNATSLCLATLATLQQAIESEAIAGLNTKEPVRPR
jgi:hypothetical protein